MQTSQPIDWAHEDASLAALIGPGFSYRDKGPDLASATRAAERDLLVLRHYTTFPTVMEGAATIARQDLLRSGQELVEAVKSLSI